MLGLLKLENKVKWIVLENIFTLLLMVGLFIYTNSAWSFLLMLNLNTIKKKYFKTDIQVENENN